MSEDPNRLEPPAIDEINAILHFFESMDRINHAIQGTNDLEMMMSEVLDTALSIFECDRAFLLYPCDPKAPSWNVPMERTRPEYRSTLASHASIPMDEAVAATLRTVLESESPVTYGSGNAYPIDTAFQEKYGVKSFMSMALFPKVDKPWHFGIHQCSRERVWSVSELRLFQEIGRRLEDGLSLLLTFQDLKKSEASYSRIVNMANDGIWVIDERAMTSFVNARMAEMLGYKPEEMLGRSVTDFMYEEDVPDYTKKLESRYQGVSGRYERRYRRKNGESVWVMISATAVLDEEQRFTGGFAMVTDITEKKRTEEDLRRLNEELEARVRERTRELRVSHAELEAAYRELKLAHSSILQQEKMASIGQLASGIAHEINTPAQYVGNNIAFLRDSLEGLLEGMALCQGSLSCLEAGRLTAAAHKNLEAMFEAIDFDYLKKELPRALLESEEGIRRISGIVSAMKDFAHPGGSALGPVELDGLIRSTVEISRNAWKRVAELSVELATPPVIVKGLRDELGQVLLNLVVNAVDAIAETRREEDVPGRIRVRTRVVGAWGEIVVEDSGCGIPRALQQKIFEPFFTTKTVGQGSGQGLAIAYHIVTDKHGGELRVESEPGRGSRFIIRLPLAEPG